MKKKIIISSIAFLTILIGCGLYFYFTFTEKVVNLEKLDYATLFNDKNSAQLQSARKYGISSTLKNREEAQNIKKELKEIKDCDYYAIDKFTHSIPYLTNGAEEILSMIGKNFQDSLESKGLAKYKIIVTSVLRTKDDIKRLRASGNPNATLKSAHCYATTFDITYIRFRKQCLFKKSIKPKILQNVLGEVLRDLRKQKKCHVKYEYRQKCFHITARN